MNCASGWAAWGRRAGAGAPGQPLRPCAAPPAGFQGIHLGEGCEEREERGRQGGGRGGGEVGGRVDRAAHLRAEVLPVRHEGLRAARHDGRGVQGAGLARQRRAVGGAPQEEPHVLHVLALRQRAVVPGAQQPPPQPPRPRLQVPVPHVEPHRPLRERLPHPAPRPPPPPPPPPPTRALWRRQLTTPSCILDFCCWATHSETHIRLRISCSRSLR